MKEVNNENNLKRLKKGMIKMVIKWLRKSKKAKGEQPKEKQTFCKLPFEKILIGTMGNVFTCCPSWLPMAIGNIFDTQDFNSIWNSETAQKIRTSMINETYEFCNHDYCPYLLKGIFKSKENDYPSKISQKTILSQGPAEINLSYDNTCNLYCICCRNHVITLSKDKIDFLLKFQENLIQSHLFQNVRKLILAGQGEVFFSKVYLNLLKSINEERFPNLRITIFTNGTLINPNMWENISNAHYAINHISVSIDAATKGTYNKVRRGGNFDILFNNIKFLSGLKKEKKLKLTASFVMQQENYQEMLEFVKLMKEYGVDSIYFGKLFNYGLYTEEEFRQVAVHRNDNPGHNAFLEILQSPVLKEPGITIQY